MEKEKLYPEMTLAQKRKVAEEIFIKFKDFLPQDIMNVCQQDFKLCSLVGYKLATAIYDDASRDRDEQMQLFNHLHISDDRDPIRGPLWAPVRYCGGNMVFGRVFAVNHCAFSSRDSIIGFRDEECPAPYTRFRILKGLRHIGYHGNWTLLKLDPASTDDMTGMLFTTHEKNFTIEFAHFPHEGGYRMVFRWEDC